MCSWLDDPLVYATNLWYNMLRFGATRGNHSGARTRTVLVAVGYSAASVIDDPRIFYVIF